MGDTEAEIQGQISKLQGKKSQIDTLIDACQNVQESERLQNQRDIKNIEIDIKNIKIRILRLEGEKGQIEGEIDTPILAYQNVQERERLQNQRDIKNIEIKILKLEIKILGEQDPEEKKLMREEKKLLREKEIEKERQLTQLMSNTTQAANATASAPQATNATTDAPQGNSLSPFRHKLGLPRGTRDDQTLRQIHCQLDLNAEMTARLQSLEVQSLGMTARLQKFEETSLESRFVRLSDKIYPEDFETMLRRLHLSIEVHGGGWGVEQPPMYTWTTEGDVPKQVNEETGTPLAMKILTDKLENLLGAYLFEDVHSHRNLLNTHMGRANLSIIGGTGFILRPRLCTTDFKHCLAALFELKRLEMGKPAILKLENHRQTQGELIAALELADVAIPGLFAVLTNCYEWWFYDFDHKHNMLRKWGRFSTDEAINHLRERLEALPNLPDSMSIQEGSQPYPGSDGERAQEDGPNSEPPNAGEQQQPPHGGEQQQSPSRKEGPEGPGESATMMGKIDGPDYDACVYELYDELDEIRNLGRPHLIFTC